MKTLYLMRHAKSSWGSATLSDFDRPLNGRGRRDAPEMGRRLAEKSPRPGIIYASPAERVRQTVLQVAEALDYLAEEIQWKKEIYEAGVEEAIRIVEGIDDSIEAALLVGHNPTMSFCVAHWDSRPAHHFPTAAIACLRLDADKWSAVGSCVGELVDFDYPKLGRD